MPEEFSYNQPNQPSSPPEEPTPNEPNFSDVSDTFNKPIGSSSPQNPSSPETSSNPEPDTSNTLPESEQHPAFNAPEENNPPVPPNNPVNNPPIPEPSKPVEEPKVEPAPAPKPAEEPKPKEQQSKVIRQGESFAEFDEGGGQSPAPAAILWITFILTVLITGYFWLIDYSNVKAISEKESEKNQVVTQLNTPENKEVEEKANNFKTAFTDLSTLTSQQLTKKDLLTALYGYFTKDVTLNTIAITQEGELQLDGATGSYRQVADFMLGLSGYNRLSEISLKSVALSTTENVSADQKIVFTITANIDTTKNMTGTSATTGTGESTSSGSSSSTGTTSSSSSSGSSSSTGTTSSGNASTSNTSSPTPASTSQ